MPHRRPATAVLAVLALGFGLASSGRSAELVIVRGGGSGNGVGMSQWGAEGYALHGWDYEQILGHYYPHTAFTRVENVPIRVLLLVNRPSVVLSSKAPFLLVDARGLRVHVAKKLELGARPRVGGVSLRLPITVDAGAQPLAVDGTAYRGSLELERSNGGLAVVNTVPLERYVRSVVPSELPDGWQQEAYRAQAVAARSYAVASIRPGATFDLYADPRSQTYDGIAAETPATDEAVGHTTGQALAYDDRVIVALYDSSSGGRTAAVEDAFPGTSPQPYLVSVRDPFDSISPYHRWQVTLTGEQIRARLGLEADSISVRHDASGLASTVMLRAAGEQRTLTGRDFAEKLGLDSTRFSLGLVSLDRPVRISATKVQLSGVAQGVSGAVIQRRQPGGGWGQVARVRPKRDGRFSALVGWTPGGVYRIAVDRIAGPAVSGGGGRVQPAHPHS
jgi:stage II sporulation protein D